MTGCCAACGRPLPSASGTLADGLIHALGEQPSATTGELAATVRRRPASVRAELRRLARQGVVERVQESRSHAWNRRPWRLARTSPGTSVGSASRPPERRELSARLDHAASRRPGRDRASRPARLRLPRLSARLPRRAGARGALGEAGRLPGGTRAGRPEALARGGRRVKSHEGARRPCRWCGTPTSFLLEVTRATGRHVRWVPCCTDCGERPARRAALTAERVRKAGS